MIPYWVEHLQGDYQAIESHIPPVIHRGKEVPMISSHFWKSEVCSRAGIGQITGLQCRLFVVSFVFLVRVG